jgi:hypothetical protein
MASRLTDVLMNPVPPRNSTFMVSEWLNQDLGAFCAAYRNAIAELGNTRLQPMWLNAA